MASSGSSETVAVAHRIKQEIDRLTDEQAKALRSATLTGMTPDQAREYDGRRKAITGLIRDLEVLRRGR